MVLWAVALVAAVVSGPLLVGSTAFSQGTEAPEENVASEPQATDEEIAASWTEAAPVGEAEEGATVDAEATAEPAPTTEAAAEPAPTTEAAAEPAPATDSWAEYRFEFADGTVIVGSNREGEAGYTGTKNAADLGLSRNVHVSCSDEFTDGWGDKGAPDEGIDPHPVVSWSIDKYKDGSFQKSCSGGTPPPPSPTPPPPPPPPPVELPRPAIDVEKLVSIDGADWRDADSAPGPEAIEGDDVRFRFVVRNTGLVMLRDLTLSDSDFAVPTAEVPASLASGDSFAVEVGPFPAVAGQHVNEATAAASGSSTEPHAYTGKRNQYTIVLADGSIFEGSVDQGDVDLGLSEKTHISCSDAFGFDDGDPSNDGWGENSAPVFGVDPYPIVKFKITRYDNDGGVRRTCGHDDPTRPIAVSDKDAAYYLGITPMPEVDLEKFTNGQDADAAPGPYLRAGSEVLWTYTVTNTGNVELTGLVVTDDRIGDVCTIPSLDAGNTFTCSATGTATTGSYENLGTVVGMWTGAKVSASDPSHYFGWRSGVRLEKATNGVDADTVDAAPAVPVGSTVTWTYAATNTGNVGLVDVVVTDDRIPASDIACASDTLAPGETVTCAATGVAADQGDGGFYRNVGSVAGTPVDASGRALGSKPVVDNDPSHYVPLSAALVLEKATNGVDADEPTGPEVTVGDPVTWTYVVSNPGGIALGDIAVTDSDPGVFPVFSGGDANGNDMLDPGEAWTFRAEGTAQLGQYRNVGTATGRPMTPSGVPIGDLVEADDPSHYLGVAQLHIGDFVWLDLNGDGVQNDGPASGLAGVEVQLLTAGGDVLATTTSGDGGAYGFSVRPGDYVVAFTAPAAAVPTIANQGDDGSDSDIDASGRTAVITVANDDLTIDAGYVRLEAGIDVEKATNGVDADLPADAPLIVVGDPVVWTYAVTNTGNVALADVVVDDNRLPAAAVVCPAATLAPGESFECEANGTAEPGGDLGAYRNVGTATGTPVDGAGAPIGIPVPSDSDPSHYVGVVARVDIEKATNGVDADAAPGPEIAVGASVEWTYTVRNDGGVPIADVAVTDSDSAVSPSFSGGDANGNGLLDVNEAWTFVAAGVAAEGQYENLGTVTGVPADFDGVPIGVAITADDPSHYVGVPTQLLRIGDFVWHDFDGDGVQNDGPEAPLAGVEVSLLDESGNVVDVTVTDANGFYAFLVEPGTYRLEFAAPAGTVPTSADRGGDDAADSDIDASGRTELVTVTADDFTIDAGFYIPASLGDLVWDDTDRDGLQDTVEPGVAGVAVALVDGSGAVLATTTTDSEGGYSFTGLRPGAYRVVFELPDGYAFTSANQGDDAVDSDADPATGVTAPTTLASGQDDPTIDAGMVQLDVVLSFVKLVNDENANLPPGPLVPVDSVVSFTFVMTNNGDVAIADVTVGDSEFGTVCTSDMLEPSETFECEVTAPAVAGQHVNIGTVVGTPVDDQGAPVGDPIVLDDPGHYFGAVAAIDIEKSTNGVDADDAAEAPLVVVGDAVTWTYAVTNTGNVTLTGITVVDDLLPADTVVCPADTLAPGASFECEASGIAEAAGDAGAYRNVGSVTGTPVDAAGEPIDLVAPRDDDPSHYLGVVARISVEKATNDADADTPPGPEVPEGSLVSWTYVVRNDGGVPIGNVTVADSDPAVTPVFVGGDDNGNGLLDVQESWLYVASGSAVAGQYENLGTATGVPTDAAGTPIGGPISDDDPSHYVGTPTALLRIGDFVWHDFDGDGVQNDGPESALAGVEVRLLDGAGEVLASTTTDGSGGYGFLVDPGTYRLEFVALPGTVPTAANQGGDDAADSDIDPAGRTALVSVNADDLTIDAGYYIPASLGDFVWVDLNRDGIQDPGEPGRPGVSVTLLDGALEPVATTVTDDNGAYGFSDLAPGTYTVQFERPDGYFFTRPDQGDDDTVDSDADPFDGTAAVTLASGDVNSTIDAGLSQEAFLGDLAWDDRNGNGIQDAGEPGIEGVTVRLFDGTGTVNLLLTVTDVDGMYRFGPLPAGDYIVEFQAPDGFLPTVQDAGTDDTLDSDADVDSGRTAVISLETGEDDPTWDAGFVEAPTAVIGDFAWEDLDRDGVQDPNEPGVEGVTVLLLNEDGTELARTVTGATGAYSFDVRPGTYIVEFQTPFAVMLTEPLAGDDTALDSNPDPVTGRTEPITVAFGEADVTIDAGVISMARFGNFVWEDEDGDGIQDAEEIGIPGVRVELLDADMAPIREVLTDEMGLYGFRVTPGTYFARFTAPDGYVFTAPDATGDYFDSDADPATGMTPPITLAPGDVNPSFDAGVYRPAQVGDFVWEDLNRNGTQDAGEPGVPGVTVRLLSGGQEIAATVTDADGAYAFDVAPGDYAVVFDAGGWALTDADAGADDVDSDADPETGSTAEFSIGSGDADPTRDAGVFRLVDLQIDKDAVPDNIAATLDFEYIVTVTNLGPSDATEVVVLDLLPARAEGTDPPYTGDFAAFPCFSDWDPAGGDDQNCVGDEAFQIDTPQFGTGEPRLHPSERGDEEIAPGVVAPQSVTLNSIAAPDGVTCEYNAAVNGVRCDVGDLAAGDSLDIAFAVSSHPLNRVRVWNRAWVYAAEFEDNLDNTDPTQPCATDAGSAFGDRGTGCNYVKKNEEISAQAELGVTKSVSEAETQAGDELVYVIEASNAGPFAAAAVAVVDDLPEDVTVTGLDDGCEYDADTHTAECAVGLMMPGDTATRTISVVVGDAAVGELVNQVSIDNREDPETGPVDLDTSNNADSAVSQVPSGTVGDTVFSDLNRNGVQDDDEPGVPGVVVVLDGAGGTVSATTDGDGRYLFTDLLAGSYVVAVDMDSVPDGTDMTTAASFTIDLAPGGLDLDADFGISQAPPIIDLEVQKTANPAVTSSAEATFTITVRNAGPDDATGVVLTDSMPSALEVIAASGDGSYSAASGVWTVGNLPAGSSASLAIEVRAVSAEAFTNVVEVTAADQTDSDSTPGDGAGDDHAEAVLLVTAVLPQTVTTTTAAPDVLPRTGIETGALTGLGAGLLALGVAALIAVRRNDEKA